jgi:ribosome-binding factor A
MANDRRVSKVASLIKREISLMLLQDIKDDRVGAGMVSITEVEVSGDLQHAKIFVSIYGSEEARAETMEGLNASRSFVRRTLGQRIRLRRSPEISFIEDRALEKGDRMIQFINQLDIKPPEAFENLEGYGENLPSDEDDGFDELASEGMV